MPMGTFSIGGTTGIESAGTIPRTHKQNLFAWSDDLFYTRSRHSLKFGTLINRYQQVIKNGGGCCGSASFTTLSSFLLAQANTIGTSAGPSIERTLHFNTLGFYAQDDWQVRSNFTLNLGMRYEFSTTPYEAHGDWSAIKDVLRDSQYTITPAIFRNPSLRSFSPRFGFAWDVRGNGKTAVRGGFGLLYDLIGGQTGTLALQNQVVTPPFSNRLQTVNPPVFTIPLTFPTNTIILFARTIDYYIKQPHMLQYNLTVERQLPFDIAVTLAYAGSRGINLISFKEVNPAVPQILPDGRQFWPVGAPRAKPNFGSLDYYTAGSNSWYNGLQFGLLKRLGKGLQFQSSYTWSRVIDENTGPDTGERSNSVAGQGTDPTHREVDRALSPFDLTQVWKFNSIYQLPSLVSSGGAVAKLLNGWWISGILTLESGFPFTPTLNSNRSRSGVGAGAGGIDRPDLAAC